VTHERSSILDEWRAAAGLSNDGERSYALATWALKHGRALVEAAERLESAEKAVGRAWLQASGGDLEEAIRLKTAALESAMHGRVEPFRALLGKAMRLGLHARAAWRDGDCRTRLAILRGAARHLAASEQPRGGRRG